MKKNNTLKQDFERACNAYLKAFCEKHGYDYNDAARSWVGGDVGGITEACDFFVDMPTIRVDIDRNAPKEEFVKWYDYCLRLGMLREDGVGDPSPNFENWLRECPRYNEAWFERAEKLHNDIQKMREELIELLITD